jgi:predicted nucleotidyltransferase
MARTSAAINQITDEIINSVQSTLGDKLRKIILYGSYARGDSDVESDVDIMILADLADSEIEKTEKLLWDIGWEAGFEYDIMVSVFLKNTSHFYEWMDAMAYYRNINEDGVVLYG